VALIGIDVIVGIDEEDQVEIEKQLKSTEVENSAATRR